MTNNASVWTVEIVVLQYVLSVVVLFLISSSPLNCLPLQPPITPTDACSSALYNPSVVPLQSHSALSVRSMVYAGFVGMCVCVCVAHSARHMRWMSMCVCVCVWYVKPGRGALSQPADITYQEHPALPTQRAETEKCAHVLWCVYL